MKTYRIHEGEIVIPETWKDQSMQVFRLPGRADRKDASIIITRDYETEIASPAGYAQTQQKAISKQFPGYKSLGQRELSIGGRPAEGVEYQWRSSGTLLQQRQAYVYTDDGCMLTVTLSAVATEFGQHEDAWAQVLDTFRFTKVDKPVATDTPSSAVETVFALKVKERFLQAFADAQQACATISAFDVEDKAVLFYSNNGVLLDPFFDVLNRRSLLARHEGVYHLQLASQRQSANLLYVLDNIVRYEGVPPFEDLKSLRDHLARQQSLSPSNAEAKRLEEGGANV